MAGAVILLELYISQLSMYEFSSYIFGDLVLSVFFRFLVKAVLELGKMISFSGRAKSESRKRKEENTIAREQFQTLTEPMYYILLALLEECCGVDIMERVQVLSRGRVRVGPGTLYTMLSKFEENRMIRLTAQEGRRKTYVITEHGKEMLQEEYLRLRQMTEDGSRFLEDMGRNIADRRQMR